LVPYLGILFCPGALFMGGLNLISSYRSRDSANRAASLTLVTIALAELAAQLTMWWIMYKVPEWTALRGQGNLEDLWRP